MIDGAPDERGVYALWDRDELIYCARASSSLTIREALREHAAGRAGACTQGATHYGWEICLDPTQREAELLAEYEARFKRLPRCNARKP